MQTYAREILLKKRKKQGAPKCLGSRSRVLKTTIQFLAWGVNRFYNLIYETVEGRIPNQHL